MKIEHRLFSFLSLNWKGEPLVSFETVVNLISATKTSKGLPVKAMLDKGRYETGIKDYGSAEEGIKPAAT
jgi:Rhodopirellula transposase DDE domain